MFIFCCTLWACQKEDVVYSDNDVPEYEGVPTVLVNNYVNSLFIDLIGREPLDVEMEEEVAALEAANLSISARQDLIDKLMFDTSYLPGDSSYSHAYHFKLYSDLKARMMEGASDGEIMGWYNLYYSQSIVDSINGNFDAMDLNRLRAQRMLDVIDVWPALRLDEIDIAEAHRRMCQNQVYNEINMGAFNFINASFNDLFDRFPTQAEFDQSFPVIEANEPGVLFGQVVQNKTQYLEVLVHSEEFDEGLVRWVYKGRLSRDPSSAEVFTLLNGMDAVTVEAIVRHVLSSEEYADF